jgi:hypothetical protein
MTAMPKSDEEAVGLTFVYDAWNRLVKVSKVSVSGSTTVTEHEYNVRDTPTGLSPVGSIAGS